MKKPKGPSPTLEIKSGAHEVKVGSERSFGLVFAVVFVIIGLFPLFHDDPIRLWALGVAALFGCAALLVPKVLRPLNLIWFKFGLLLYKIVNPIIMGLLFVVTIVPTGLLLRLAGKDPLKRKFDKNAKTYWIERDPPGPAPTSLKRQY